MSEAIIVPDAKRRIADQQPIAATGRSFDVYEWSSTTTSCVNLNLKYWNSPY